jgi:hypothetical protein
MAKSIFGLTFDLTSDTATAFRAFGSTLSAQLGAMLTRFPTSYDINWSTVSLPAGGTYAGFEVYRFNDSLQTSHPLFLKFWYGQSIGGGYALRLTIAKNCAADGTLSGIVLPTSDIAYSAANSSTPQTCYISNGDGSSLCLALAPTFINIGSCLIIERAFNSNGTLNGDGLWVSFRPRTADYGNAGYVFWVNYMCAYTAETYNYIGWASNGGIFPIPLALSPGQGLANGNTTPYFPAACLAPNGLYWLPRAALGGSRVECAAGTVVNNLLDGHNYIGIGQLGSHSDLRCNNEASMLMRWD